MAKTSLLMKEQNKHLKGEVGQVKRGTGPRMMKYGSFQDRVLNIHLDGTEIRVLIDSCMLHNNRLSCTCLSHNSICYNQICVCIEYLWTLQGSWLPKVTWHSCAPRMHTLMLEKSLRLFCRISVNTPGLHWGMSGMRLRHQLESFPAWPSLLAHAWLPT